MTTIPTPRRGEVWWIDFDPSVPPEQQKVRPAVVMNNERVGRLHLRIVVPITGWRPGYEFYRWFVHLAPTAENGLTKESGADAFQVKSHSLNRFRTRLGILTPEETEDIAAAIASCVGY
jgi:mRNA interferase MazF